MPLFKNMSDLREAAKADFVDYLHNGPTKEFKKHAAFVQGLTNPTPKQRAQGFEAYELDPDSPDWEWLRKQGKCLAWANKEPDKDFSKSALEDEISNAITPIPAMWAYK